MSPSPPAISAHQLISSGRSTALVRRDGEVTWWCAPEPDDPPLLWSLLDDHGSAARWLDALVADEPGPPAGPSVQGCLRIDGRRVFRRDGLVEVGGAACLVRLVRAATEAVELHHELTLGGFDGAVATFDGPGSQLGDLRVRVIGGDDSTAAGALLRTTVRAEADRWTGLAVCVGDAVDDLDLDEIVTAVDDADRDAEAEQRRARLPRHHPDRAADALAVLGACTYPPTGAVLASVTTSLPEAPGADRQFDYRFSWVRDAALSVSVASLLGQREAAARYLRFIHEITGDDGIVTSPTVDVRGGPVKAEREVDGVRGWADSRPIRVGNSASNQLQHDAWAFVVEAVSVYLETGGSLDRRTWQLVRGIADHMTDDDGKPSSGMWEFRTPRRVVSADLARWLALDRAIAIARLRRPFSRRGAWKRGRQQARERVLGALRDDGSLPHAYDGEDRPDASALMAVVFGMLQRGDPRADRLVDATIERLGAGPLLYRYDVGIDDGFAGVQGAFLPMAWWAVAALAELGRLDEAVERCDALCSRLPRLLSEEVDPVDWTSLGNVPLVWSHIEMARAFYILDAAAIRRRWGPVGVVAWRAARFLRMRLVRVR